MALLKFRGLLLLISVAILCQTASAQATRRITVRVLDAKTGERITPSGILVRINHQTAEHHEDEWVHQNEDGTADLTLPEDAQFFLFHSTYDSSTETYVNCDGMKRYDSPGPRWYSVADVLTKGVVADNGCVNQAKEDKIKAAPAPGQIVMYVRKQNWREESKD